MTALFFALFFIVSLAFGSFLTFLVVSLIIREDVKNTEGLYVVYNKKSDKWTIFGDIDNTLNKMRSHYKEPEVYDKARLEQMSKENKAKSKVRWYRK